MQRWRRTRVPPARAQQPAAALLTCVRVDIAADSPPFPQRRCAPSRLADGVLGCIGDTPLVRIASLSEATGCVILGKAEFLSPGGSIKDRVALHIVTEALRDGRLRSGGLVTEGTAGSTGVSLALVSA